MPTLAPVVVVDAANVVGSRPDGWWRDRPGAARRLHDRLATAELEGDEVVLVLEGAARSGQSPGVVRRVRTVHADGSGDDAIVQEVRTLVGADAAVLVVTADRGLRVRVQALGADIRPPSWLLAQLPD